MKSVLKTYIHPSIIQAVENKDPTITGLIGYTVQFEDPNVRDAIIEDAKQFGIHFQIDLKQEENFLNYDHWHDETKGPFTKRKLARKFAKAWNSFKKWLDKWQYGRDLSDPSLPRKGI